jgi:hypothetical protein
VKRNGAPAPGAGAAKASPGAIVAPLSHEQLMHELITQRGRATRLELLPLPDDLRAALRWRIAKLLPIVASPAYAPLWSAAASRLALLDAVFASGDFHYGTSRRELRQAVARWLHSKLSIPATPTRAAAKASAPAGASMSS